MGNGNSLILSSPTVDRMLLKLPYGEGGLLKAEVPDENMAGIVGPHEVHCSPTR